MCVRRLFGALLWLWETDGVDEDGSPAHSTFFRVAIAVPLTLPALALVVYWNWLGKMLKVD